MIPTVSTYLSLVLSQALLSYSTLIMLTRISPPGVATDTSEPTSLPSRLFAMGESLEIFPSNGSASALPTIVYVSSSSSGNSLNVTDFPRVTTSWFSSSFSMITELRIIFSTCAIRVSTKACSSLAASYSEFSERSTSHALFLYVQLPLVYVQFLNNVILPLIFLSPLVSCSNFYLLTLQTLLFIFIA